MQHIPGSSFSIVYTLLAIYLSNVYLPTQLNSSHIHAQPAIPFFSHLIRRIISSSPARRELESAISNHLTSDTRYPILHPIISS